MQLARQLLTHPAFAAMEVVVQHGVVTLSGVVPSLRAKMHAELLASQTPNVVDVDNQLAVRPPPSGTPEA